MKKKILYLAFRFPYPQTDGYKIRVYNYCKIIKELGNDIDLFFIYENENEYLEYLEHAQDIFTNIYPIKLKKNEKIFNLLKSIFLGQSLQENLYITKQGKEKLGNIEIEKYDFVFSSYIRMFKYLLKEVPKKKRVIDFTDSISYHYDDARKISKGLWNIIHRYEFFKVKKYEHFVLDNCDKRMITSPLDRDYILKDYKGQNKKIEIFSQGIDISLIKRSEQNQTKLYDKVRKLVFLGKMNYYPNEDAVISFCENILPRLKNVELTIVGTSPTEKVLELTRKNKNVRVTGFVDDPYEYVLDAHIMIAPMRLGGGVQNKILEGMALGKSVVSYEERIKSIEGIQNYKNIIGVRTDEEIISILNNTEENFIEIGLQARKLVERNYTWNSMKLKFGKFILD